MLKIAIAAVAAAPFVASSAMAGPYLGVNTKTDFVGTDYTKNEIKAKVGYSDKFGESSNSYFVEGGTKTIATDGTDGTTNLFVAGGLGFKVSDAVSANVSVEGTDNDSGDTKYQVKSGFKYSF